MFRKADRDRLEALKAWADQFHAWEPTVSAQLKALAAVQQQARMDGSQATQLVAEALHGPVYDFNRDRKGGVFTRLERIEAGLDTLGAELTTKPNRLDLAATHEALNRLNEFVGANQAVLDTLVQRVSDEGLSSRALLAALERKIDQRWADTVRVLEALHSRSHSNGKRKKKAA